MATKNLVSAELSASDLSDIKAAIQTIATKMPFLINLTEEQRQSGLKLGDKTVSFVDKVLDYSKANPHLIPPYLDTLELTKDYKLARELVELARLLKPLIQNIDDTAMEAGIEALSAALVFYNAVKAASKQGVQGAKVIYEDLQKRFPGGSNTKHEGENKPPVV